ncbi:biotin-dependent carboxyltransferase family protein [Heyndrickxia sporothermodurans]|uniref:Biotin-dependent carboxyltransferase n=1 Tax=Heyndrickxia sporothermodurans TaxID=46224 RepID=A0AB37HPU8_9BACI|nr:biotin-dependent carboxyltransferase family protein [Heyndrickxia sporothermodurans]MBL5782116.1 biotin-dependent carboxyltransferase [Heyndrickxia sporothermodurans]MBL5796426.1 biotin-dependent carboxyltransferase [Heyndrickxia sporothermodurans]MBL5803858.1 biotin-dependent carboxyltransferase [Heyndrickxia sporothermodurans]MBL5807439.1 biotin-dependent carboxyltransferase [Heyndrickxia sporothermodurans]MBL5832032.1 biotin-dependent carboxyltransferase [Heyndrickxia sporothermodurans]
MHPGVFTTVQDLGRPGYQKYGLAVSGSADHYSHRVANILVGNPESSAVLEVTLMGLKMKSLKQTVIAVTGGDLTFTINGVPSPMWCSVKVNEGDVIHFAGCRSGCRAYISVLGGITVPEILGSRSTDTIGKIGGIEGRALKKGDIIPFKEQPLSQFQGIRRRLPEYLIPTYTNSFHLRVILGPQEGAFSKKAIDTFLSSTYKATKDVNRMGCRLEGPVIEHIGGADITSEGIFFGAIQVPKNGQPIIFLVGRQSVGGYTKIGGVITVDLPKLAQVKPGDRITFERITVEEAHVLLKEKEHDFSILKAYSNN